MNDRELLELAAKAAGIAHVTPMMIEWGQWNPLTDDGDALRLAVKLRLLIDTQYNNGVGVGSASIPWLWVSTAVDPYAATRRAIVKAAAEIGKGM